MAATRILAGRRLVSQTRRPDSYESSGGKPIDGSSHIHFVVRGHTRIGIRFGRRTDPSYGGHNFSWLGFTARHLNINVSRAPLLCWLLRDDGGGDRQKRAYHSKNYSVPACTRHIRTSLESRQLNAGTCQAHRPTTSYKVRTKAVLPSHRPFSGSVSDNRPAALAT